MGIRRRQSQTARLAAPTGVVWRSNRFRESKGLSVSFWLNAGYVCPILACRNRASEMFGYSSPIDMLPAISPR